MGKLLNNTPAADHMGYLTIIADSADCSAWPGKDEVLLGFYAFDPKLKGYHQTYIDCNRIKLVR